MEEDVRWEQRFSNYIRALDKLHQSLDLIDEKISDQSFVDEEMPEIELLKTGAIKFFEMTFELAWKVMQDYIIFQGNDLVNKGPKGSIREAFQMELIKDGHVWMEMTEDRNLTSHTYNQSTADEIFDKIVAEYYPLFLSFQQMMDEKRSGEQSNLFQ